MDNVFEELRGKYTLEDMDILEELNSFLSVPSFSSELALQIGSKLVKRSIDYKEECAIRITREADECVIFQYIGNSKSNRNINFLLGKRNAVLATKHASIYGLVCHMVDGSYNELFAEDSISLPVAGAFPIFVNDELYATIAVSGLHNGNDYRIVIETLEEVFKRNAPIFKGPLI